MFVGNYISDDNFSRKSLFRRAFSDVLYVAYLPSMANQKKPSDLKNAVLKSSRYNQLFYWEQLENVLKGGSRFHFPCVVCYKIPFPSAKYLELPVAIFKIFFPIPTIGI